MDYGSPPKIFVPQQSIVGTRPARLLPPISVGRRAVLIVNRGSAEVYLGADDSVSSSNGFRLDIGEGIAVATMAAVWGTTGTYHMVTLSE